MATPKSKNKKIKEISVDVNTTTFVGSQFAQFASVSVTDSDVTMDFVFVVPQNQSGHVVSRVTMPKAQAELLADLVKTTVKNHASKDKK